MADNYTFEERAGRTGAAKDIGGDVIAARVQPIQGTSDVTTANPLQVEDVNAVNVVAAPGAALPTGRIILGAGDGANADGLISDGIGGLRVRTGANVANVASSFSRPANATPYDVGDLIANDTTAASVTAMSWPLSRNSQDGIIIFRARMNKSDDDTINARFRLHLFTTDPNGTTMVNGDNGALSLNTDISDYLGAFDFDMAASPDIYNTAGNSATGAPVDGLWQEMAAVTASASSTIYGLLEARAAYTPVSGETFEVILEVVQS